MKNLKGKQSEQGGECGYHLFERKLGRIYFLYESRRNCIKYPVL